MEMKDIYSTKVNEELNALQEDMKNSGLESQQFMMVTLAQMTVMIKEQTEAISKLAEFVSNIREQK